jgi:pimeloyl-ACP methyl ester carboxylesterase
MNEPVDKKPLCGLMILALILILGGGYLAHLIQTSGGVEIRDLRFMSNEGKLISALLYVPKGVNQKNPAPGILATHGYINSRETQDGFAIEFARRGYVVLAIDQSGHGFSDPPSGGNGFGGIPALAYLRSLDFVDKNNIGIEGHSMGGWASLKAAESNPDGYRSLILASSSTGTYGTKEGTPAFPRNAALIYSKYDEFSGLMWNSPIPGNIVKTDKLKKFFGTTETVEVGKLYGSIEEGTARKLYQPSITHARVHFSTEAIGNAVEWMQTTLKGGKNIPPSDQIWYWKEIGTLLALIGMVILIFPVGRYFLRTEFFEELNETPSPRKSIVGPGWWLGAVITILLPVPLYMKIWDFHGLGFLKASYLWPQTITTVLMVWAVKVGVISLILLLLWHFLLNRKTGASFIHYGLTWKDKGLEWGKVGKSFLLAVVVVFAAYLTLAFSDWAFKTDFRIWVFAIKPMSVFQFKMVLAYFIPFTFYFLISGMVLHGQLRRGQKDGRDVIGWKEMLTNILLMIGGYILYLVYQYTPLLSGGTAAVTTRWAPLYSIVMFQFLPIFTIVALVSTYFYRKTGHVFVGSFINAMVVTWIVVAGQATHFPY